MTFRRFLLLAVPLVCLTVVPAGIAEELATPDATYDALKAVVEAEDMDGFRALMSTKLAKRLQADYYVVDAIQKGKKYFEKVPKGDSVIDGESATMSKTYDEETVTATYSLQFALEDGQWKFDGYKTSTKAK